MFYCILFYLILSDLISYDLKKVRLPSLNMGSLGTKPVEKAHKALLSTFAEEVSKGAVEAAHLKLAAEVAGDKLFCTQRTWLCQTCVYIHTTYIYICHLPSTLFAING